MKKVTLILTLVFCASLATFAQKGKVMSAESYFTAGKLDEAKKMIDEAITHEKSVNDPMAYFIKGQIYQAIAESPLETYKNLDANALNVAWDAFQKTIALDVKGRYTKKLKTQYDNLIIDYTNKAVEFYNGGDFKAALAAFEKVLEIEKSEIVDQPRPADTVVIFNAGITAQKAGDLAKAEMFFKQTLELNYEPAKIYAMLSDILKEQGKEEESLKYLHEGYEKFPGDSYMLVQLINYYLSGGEPEKAEKYLDAVIEQDPNNASFYRAKGSLYEKTGEMDKAEEMYKKALSIDPKEFVAQYNLGSINLNKVIDFHNKVNEILDVNEYNKKIKEVYAAYETVIPYFEKAREINPTDANTLSYLKELYFKLRNEKPEYMQKYEEVQKAVDALK
ncbi:MAG: tetratricopeptide repeat protein [Culturomica sp.]|jgi:tetratricopeptide (TPR) repeat protein|nr:tetratricopeptide repeat protein [Culturomica sp.]